MKKLIGILLLLLLFTVNGFSQQIYYHWFSYNSPVTGNLNSITNYNPYLLLTGNSGTILFSSNAGTNWTTCNTGVSADLYSINSGTPMFAVGTGGTILKSSNIGLNWTSIASPTTNNLYSVWNYVTPNYIIVCGSGGKIYTSTNAGTNWTEIASGTTNSLRNISIPGSAFPHAGYICGYYGTLLKLTFEFPPLPVTISVSKINTGFTNLFNDVAVLGDTNKLILTGSGGIILKTTNGGTSWTRQSSGTTNELKYINAISENDVWIGGENGTMLHTNDGGINWIPQVVYSNANLNSMNFISATKAYTASGSGLLTCEFPALPTDTSVKNAILEGNNIRAYFNSAGIFNQKSISGTQPGFEWPKGSGKTACYTSGFNISALVNGNIRQALCYEYGEFRSGTMKSGTAEHPAVINRIFSVKTGDNGYNSVDWANWGEITKYGAPYIDVNRNGKYDIFIDTPGVRRASQTIFMTLTDGFPASHNHPWEAFLGGTLPLNADLMITAWCYNDSVVKDVQFIKFDIVNRGTFPWNNVSFSLLGDFNIGHLEDDYYATDSIRNMWIGYNGDNMDGDGTGNTYGASPPAMGMRVLKFPVNNSVVPKDTIKTTVGDYFFCCLPPEPLCEIEPDTPLETYNMMKGFKKDLSPWMNPTFSPPAPTKFIFSGEPEPDTGWTESKGKVLNCGGTSGIIRPTNLPGDRNFLLSLGKDNFTMNPGDSQSVLIAQLIARGTNNLNSVTKLKQLSDLLPKYIDSLYGPQLGPLLPDGYWLGQNFPNPYNMNTSFQYAIPKFSDVKIVLYDLLGREMRTLVNEARTPGIYDVTFNASQLASGIYFYRMTAGEFTQTKKMILLK